MQGYEKFFRQARQARQERSSRHPSDAGPSGSGPSRLYSLKREDGETPEQHLRRALSERIRRKKKKILKKKKAPFPKSAAAIAFAGLIIASTGLVYPESVEWAMDHVEIGFLVDADAADEPKPAGAKAAGVKVGEEKTAADNVQSEENPAAKITATKGGTVPDTTSWSPEELSFFNKLSERKKELDLREAELNRLEEELQKQKVELDEKIHQLEEMRSQIAKTLKTRVDNDQEKVAKLVEVYSGMKPQQAAKVIETINEDLAVQVLDRMKKKSAAEVLNVMDAKKARKLSEMLAGYKRPE